MTANLFLIGAPRAGTTSLFEYLARHPDVFGPTEKEPHRFDHDVLDGRRGMDENEYLALYAAATKERWRLDASALYLYSPQALAAVSAVPGSHVIISLRDPIELIASWHGLLVATGSEPNESFEDALAVESADGPFERRYSEIARLSSYVERWLKRLGADRVHVVLFEELTGPRSDAVGRQLLSDLDLDPLELGPFPRRNSYRRPAPIRLTGSPGLRRAARALLPARVRRRLWWSANAALTPHGERPPVSAQLRERLELELDADVRRLGELVGRNVRELWFGGQQPRS